VSDTAAPLTAPPSPGLQANFRAFVAGVCTPVSLVTPMTAGDRPPAWRPGETTGQDDVKRHRTATGEATTLPLGTTLAGSGAVKTSDPSAPTSRGEIYAA